MKRIRTLSIILMLAGGLVLIGSANLSRIQASIEKPTAKGDAGQIIARPLATLTVNSTADTPDVAPGNMICADALGNCTLRAAIQEANALAGVDMIQFNIGTGTPTITPASRLPDITQPIIIDGNSGGATRVELNGTNTGSEGDGLVITGGSSTVRNMVINRFRQFEIILRTNGNNKVEGCYLGTNATGTATFGNSEDGVLISNAPNNTIGGTTAGARNVISGNEAGVVINGSSATGNKVEGNFIGTDVNGTADLGNLFDGVFIIDAPNNTIGGTTASARNVISGNNRHGVNMTGSITTGNQIQGNFIGTQADGSSPLPNSLYGVFVNISNNNTIGGTTGGASNIIAFNTVQGVSVSSGTGNRIQTNSIFSNGGPGIDLNDNGVTLNDPCDPDSGANNRQNFPVITSATTNGGSITVTGSLNSNADTQFTIEFFANSTPDPSGFGEGQIFLGSTTVTTSGAGGMPPCTAAFAVNLPVPVTPGFILTATATNTSTNDTSEFSQGFVVGTKPPFDFDADRKSDTSVWRPSTGTWLITNSSNSSTTSVGWGVNGDQIVPGDYDMDNKADIAVWRPSTSVWFIINSSNNSTTITGWGISTDIPVPGDYDGDGKTDIAVWRPSSGTWFIINSSNGTTSNVVWGVNGDAPATGDYDGDGKSDIAVWRPSSGTWFIINSSNGTTSNVGWGVNGDKIVVGDYDGDRKTDLAVWRPSTGTWFIRNSSDGSTTTMGWGVNTDVAVPDDYDGDGKTDIAVWRPSSGTWFIVNSSNGLTSTVVWGVNGDVPAPSAYVRP